MTLNKLIRKPLSVKGGAKYPIDVLGCTAEVFNFKSPKYLGTIFFMDLDTKIDFIKNEDYFLSVLEEFELSHLCFFETQKGYHIICFQIKSSKISYYELFTSFKRKFGTDYEYGYNWILRLSSKGINPSPIYIDTVMNFDIKYKPLSYAHLSIYKRFCGLPLDVIGFLCEYQNNMNTFANFVKYKTWNYKTKKDVQNDLESKGNFGSKITNIRSSKTS